MKLARRMILGIMGTAALCLLGVALAGGQQAAPGQAGAAAPAEKELLAEDVYKNIQVFRGVPENQFLSTMGFFAGSLNESCEFCHKSEIDWPAYAMDNDQKNMARKMVIMMQGINQAYFGGRQMVTCYTCHRGSTNPKVTPTFAEIYNPNPVNEDPDVIAESVPDAPPAEPIIDKYLQAIGGMQRLNAVTSFVAKGTYEGYSAAEGEKRGIDIYAKAPGQRTTIMHTINGDMTTTYDSRTGWVAEPGRPVPLLALTGLFLDIAKTEAELSFPVRIKQTLKNWRVGNSAIVAGKECDVLFADSTAAGAPVKLYFDQQTGLLMRFTRFTNSPVGRYRYETDYSDYRLVGGIRMPYRQLMNWMDGRATVTLTSIQTNVPIADTQFAKPAPAKLEGPAAR